MITRFLSEAEPVHAFDHKLFHSCTVSGFTCSCGVTDTGGAMPYATGGRIIDRLALSRKYAAVKLSVFAFGDIQCSAGSTVMTNYIGVQVGLQHSVSTCSGGFVDFSTGDWAPEQAFTVVATATTTSGPFYSAVAEQVAGRTYSNAGLLTTNLTTSTSTGYAALAGMNTSAIPLTGANRFIRMVILPHIETTGCGGSNATIGGTFIFGHPEEAPSTGPLGRVWVSSGNTT